MGRSRVWTRARPLRRRPTVRETQLSRLQLWRTNLCRRIPRSARSGHPCKDKDPSIAANGSTDGPRKRIHDYSEPRLWLRDEELTTVVGYVPGSGYSVLRWGNSRARAHRRSGQKHKHKPHTWREEDARRHPHERHPDMLCWWSEDSTTRGGDNPSPHSEEMVEEYTQTLWYLWQRGQKRMDGPTLIRDLQVPRL